MIPRLTSPPVITSVDLSSILTTNPALGHPLVTSLLTSDIETGPEPYLAVLGCLPPTLPSFDLIGRLLRDSTTVADITTGGKTTIADLVRTEVLGWFIHECVVWLDCAEQDEREGNISDDRFAKGVQNVRRPLIPSLRFLAADVRVTVALSVLQLAHQALPRRPRLGRGLGRDGALHPPQLALRGRQRALPRPRHGQVLTSKLCKPAASPPGLSSTSEVTLVCTLLCIMLKDVVDVSVSSLLCLSLLSTSPRPRRLVSSPSVCFVTMMYLPSSLRNPGLTHPLLIVLISHIHLALTQHYVRISYPIPWACS